MTRFRHTLVRVHRWFGLLGALWLFLLGFTGSLLVFHREIDSALNPAFHHALSTGTALSLDEIARGALAGRPGTFVRYLDLPDHAGEPVRASLGELPGSRPGLPAGLEIAVDPASATVQAERARGELTLDRERLIPFLYTFHYSLQLGQPAIWALGALAFLWLLDHGVAAVLAFPNPRRWAQSFRIRAGARGHRRIFDLHRAAGLWLFPVTLVVSVTGMYLNWPSAVRGAVNAFSPITPRYDQNAPVLVEPLYAPPVGFERAAQVARQHTGGARVDGISYNPAKGSYFANVIDPRDLDDSGWRWIFVDGRSAAILADRHPADGTAGDRILAWQFPLHSGKAFGWLGRMVILAAGVGVCTLVVTGLLLWTRKRRARITAEARTPTGAREPPCAQPSVAALASRTRRVRLRAG
jgi:uncharacterized iron-regulated membrane protein